MPWGHNIIDGGANRLPRTFYNPTQDPPRLHEDFCIAEVLPHPPIHEIAFWREQVRLFLTDHLNWVVVDHQTSVFGVGLFRMHNAMARHALVQHPPFQLQDNVFVRFMDLNDGPNHRAALGFRRGWLMFLGIPPDYRNDTDLSNAVSTFGKFHHWNCQDHIASRALVFASFNSVASVPRDVVFGKYANIGGVRESWTVPDRKSVV